ncbi:hypothetical protein FB451DRAFT_1567863 [Mycena latifolia]|nr:hypothetical protein FB451DRAFT_1567863 [Mycena latifolia]
MTPCEGGAHTAALSLPYELTSQIFIHTLPLHARIRPGQKRAPLQLAQVCSLWRAVALATPQLWSSIYLEFPTGGPFDGIPTLLGIPDTEPVCDHTCELLELWLLRAASYPVSISLICADSGINLPEPLMAILADHASHWGRIELKITTQDFTDFNHISGPFPLLRSLAIRLTDHCSEFPSVTAFHCSPNLKSFHLSDVFCEAMPPPDLESIPVALVALEIIDWNPTSSFDDYLRSFEQFPDLLHLRLIGPRYWDMIPNAVSPHPVLRSLKSLSLGRSPQFLHLIDVPTLEHLEFPLPWRSLDITHLTNFLSRPASRLNHLSLHIQFPDWERHLTPLAAAISLATLELYYAAVHGPSRSARYQSLQSLLLGDLPHLRKLKITDARHRANYTSFLRLLDVQCVLTDAELHMRPRHAHLRIPPPTRALLGEFEAAAAQGLRIRVTAPNFAWPHYIEDGDALANPENDVGGFLRAFHST